jgi:hypothetical protein
MEELYDDRSKVLAFVNGESGHGVGYAVFDLGHAFVHCGDSKQEAIGRSGDALAQSAMRMDCEQSSCDDYVGRPLVSASILYSTGLGILDAIRFFVEQL